MGTAVLEYDRDLVEEAARHAVTEQARVESGPRVFTGLSVFDIPNGVRILTFPGLDRFELHFSYPNREPGEEAWRVLPTNKNVHVCVGRHTGKILQLRVDGATEMLRPGRLSVDPSNAIQWVGSRSSHVQKTGLMNAVIVFELVGLMPDSVRQDVLAQLSMAADSQIGGT